jgi:transposase-like protein
MAHGPEKKAAARQLYVTQRLPLTAVAERLDVALSTVRAWKRKAEQSGDDWDQARQVTALTDSSTEGILSQLVSDYVQLHAAVVDQVKEDPQITAAEKVKALSMLADSFSKTMNSAEKVSPKMSRLAIATDVIQRLSQFVAEKYPQHAEAFLEILEPFGKRIAKVYGE